MPIKGMTDTPPQLTRLGTIRKGDEKKGNRPGKNLNQEFRFESNMPSVQDDFDTVFGTRPKKIQFYLPYKTTDENFEAWYEEYNSNALIWRGDGEKLVLHLDRASNKYDRWQMGDKNAPNQPSGGKPCGRLAMIVPALNRLGIVTALTTSKNDIVRMTRNLRAIESIYGTLQGVKCNLTRVPVEISKPVGEKRIRATEWLLQIEPAKEWVNAQLQSMNMVQIGNIQSEDMLQLSESVELVEADESEIVEEIEEDTPPKQEKTTWTPDEIIRGVLKRGDIKNIPESIEYAKGEMPDADVEKSAGKKWVADFITHYNDHIRQGAEAIATETGGDIVEADELFPETQPIFTLPEERGYPPSEDYD